MPFSPKIIGNPMLPAIHGGMTGAFLETTAIVGVTRELGVSPPKPIGLTINYLRSGRALDSYANVSIVKQGRRVVAFEAQAWQDDRAKPIASAFGHFMLRRRRARTRNRRGIRECRGHSSDVAGWLPPQNVGQPRRRYPNSQDPGLAIGLCSLISSRPLTMRISDQMNHQTRIGKPISTRHSGRPIERYNSPIQKVLINR